MPLPISPPSGELENAFRAVVDRAQGVLTHTRGIRAAMEKPVGVDPLVAFYTELNSAKAFGVGVQSFPGLADYAKEKMGDPSYDLIGSFGAALVAGQAVTDWLLAHLPNDGAGGFVAWRLSEDKTFSRVMLSPDDLAELVVLVDALISAIEG